ncbi:MAG: hypothetical protein K6G50_07265 [bacterium]|nr:hypothetical protein [bacterium]
MKERNYNTPSARHALKRILTTGITVSDLADLLYRADVSISSEEALNILESNGVDYIGITRHGRLIGWTDAETLKKASTCGEAVRDFSERTIIEDTASLKTVIIELSKANPVFVRVMGETAAVVCLEDLQEAPMRMWLFCLITLAESLMSRMIEMQFPDDKWMDFLSEGRIEKMKFLQKEREKRGENVSLAECMQFADKADIIIKYEPSRKMMEFSSKREGQQYFQQFALWRDCLAHSQHLPTQDLKLLVSLAENLENLLSVIEKPVLIRQEEQKNVNANK